MRLLLTTDPHLAAPHSSPATHPSRGLISSSSTREWSSAFRVPPAAEPPLGVSRLSQVAYPPPAVAQSTVTVTAVTPLVCGLFRPSPWLPIPGWSSAAHVPPVPAFATPAVGALPVWGLIPLSPHSSTPE